MCKYLVENVPIPTEQESLTEHQQSLSYLHIYDRGYASVKV